MDVNDSPPNVDDPMPSTSSIIAAAALVGAAGVHAAAAVGHAAHGSKYLMMFVAAAFLEAGAAVAVVAWRRAGAVLALAVSVGLTGAWLLSRTVGLLGDPPEPIGASDVLATALHVVAVAAAVVSLRTHEQLDLARTRRDRAVGFVAAAVILLMTVPAMSAATSGHEDHHGTASGTAAGHDSDHDTHGADVVADPPGGTEAMDDSPSDGHDHGTPNSDAGSPADVHVHGSEECTTTPDQQRASDEFVADVEATLASRFPTIDAAEAEGYATLGGASPINTRGLNGTWHLTNENLYGDGRIMDPDAPEMVIFGRNAEGGTEPIGVMFQLDDADASGPQPFGCIDAWHSHEQSIVPGESAKVPMLHVWTIDLTSGPFDHQGSPEYACRYLDETGVARGYVVEPPDCVAREVSSQEATASRRRNGGS